MLIQFVDKECDHEFFCIYRHPGSDLRCQKCHKIITQAEHYQYLIKRGHK